MVFAILALCSSCALWLFGNFCSLAFRIFGAWRFACGTLHLNSIQNQKKSAATQVIYILFQVANFSAVHPDYGKRIEAKLTAYKSKVTKIHFVFLPLSYTLIGKYFSSKGVSDLLISVSVQICIGNLVFVRDLT